MARLKVLQFTIFVTMLSTLAQEPDLQNKCGSCPCNNPCNPPPYPPPPALPPPPPPAPKKPPPSTYCPPPPSGGGGGGGGGGQYPPSPPYIYINGPPGNLYPIDAYYSGSGRSFNTGLLPFLIIVLGLVTLW